MKKSRLTPEPKCLVKKTIKRWENIYSDSTDHLDIYNEKRNADRFAGDDRIACVELTGTYEVNV